MEIDWNLISAISGLVAALLSIGAGVVYFQHREPPPLKELVYHWFAHTVETPTETFKNFPVTWKGPPASNAYAVTIWLVNGGNVPVPATDFDGVLAFETGAHSEILHIESYGNGRAAPDVSALARTVQIEPLLLNPHDAIVINMIVKGFKAVTLEKGHIKGVERVRALDPEQFAKLIPTVRIA